MEYNVGGKNNEKHVIESKGKLLQSYMGMVLNTNKIAYDE